MIFKIRYALVSKSVNCLFLPLRKQSFPQSIFNDLKQNIYRRSIYIFQFCAFLVNKTRCLQFNYNLLRRKTDCRNYTQNRRIKVAKRLITHPSHPSLPSAVFSENCKATSSFLCEMGGDGRAIKGLPVTRLSMGLAPCFAHPRVCHIYINHLIEVNN